VKPSRKYPKKPRFCTFDMSANILEPSAYSDPHLPIVVALGDAQVDLAIPEAIPNLITTNL